MTSIVGQLAMPKSPPELPNELYGTIVDHLHYRRDKHTLLHLALVSKAWCAESQRVLFNTITDEHTDLDMHQLTHSLLLQAIISNPTRLGPYVRTYQQRKLVCNPSIAASHWLKPYGHMWELTEQALPALINLQHLTITPICDDGNALAFPLDGRTLNLQSLIWGFSPFNPSRADTLIAFLRTQHSLMHLEVGGIVSHLQEFTWLPDDVCPSIISSRCGFDSPMVHRKDVVGLSIAWIMDSLDGREPGPDDERQFAGLRNLKYLQLGGDRDVVSQLGTSDCNLVLLEIGGWSFRKVRPFPSFPNLRVLVFVRNRAYQDVKTAEDAKAQIVIDSYRQCPNFEYVVMQDVPAVGDTERRYKKLSIRGPLGGPDTTPDIQSEEFRVECEPGDLWWTAYGVQ